MEEKFSERLIKFRDKIAPDVTVNDIHSLANLLIEEAQRREDWEDRVNKELHAYLGVSL